MKIQSTKTIFESRKYEFDVSVVVPLYNYENYIVETLNSVKEQSFAPLELIIVDDASTDESCRVAKEWLERESKHFGSTKLLKNNSNAGLSITRNTGVFSSRADFVFPLDADNILYERCIETLHQALVLNPTAAFAYPILEKFGSESGLLGTEVFSQDRLAGGNYIDAMALIRREALIRYDGYADLTYGWEDYDLWLRMSEEGDYGIQVAQILARYRVHPSSMLRTVTNERRNAKLLIEIMKQRHPYLRLNP